MQNASTLFIYLFYSSIETSPTKYNIPFLNWLPWQEKGGQMAMNHVISVP